MEARSVKWSAATVTTQCGNQKSASKLSAPKLVNLACGLPHPTALCLLAKMASLNEQTQNALDEGRTLILGAQVLVGALYRTGFEPGFDQFSETSKTITVIALGLILLAITLLISPASYHRIATEGEDEPSFNNFVLQIMKFGLVPFAFSLGLTIYVATAKVINPGTGLIAGIVAAGLALFFWYGLEFIARRMPGTVRRQVAELIPDGTADNANGEDEENMSESKDKELDYKVRHVLTEARMILPGAQALLGFQFVTFVLSDFDRLPESSRQVHLASLLMMGIATILLMTPAAFHRLAENGRNTESFHRFAGRVLLVSLVPLALGICGDFFVIVRKTTDSSLLGIAVTGAILALSYGLWFALPMYRRHRPAS